MPKQSAGILLYRIREDALEVLLVHPGGPFWAKKDAGSWSIPKGELAEGEDARRAARREFVEEMGSPVPEGTYIPLPSVRLASGKVIHAWAIAADYDPKALRSTTCTIEWPPRSGKMCTFPEVDRAAWWSMAEAREHLHAGQQTFLDALEERLCV